MSPREPNATDPNETAATDPELQRRLERVVERETEWIEMTDGVRLAAKLWLPEDAPETPVPAILEYLPYRRRDGTRERDVRNHPWFAAHGYASARVDMRGTGDATGVQEDEYLPQEQQDGLEILKWIAAQPWCSGSVGMVGISWGGFNGLQMAALNPPELKAVITMCSTDDRYEDDIHIMGGAQLIENFSWATTMLGNDALPPDPESFGDGWRDAWRERLEGGGFWLEEWLRHQRRDAFWEHGSVCEDHAAIRCPVFAIGGWADGYTRTVFRLLRHLSVPTYGLVGPWSHTHPNTGMPGPAVGYLKEALRFWDRYLKGVENDMESVPALRAWMQESAPPNANPPERPGRWVAEPAWPTQGVQERTLRLAPGRIVGALPGSGGDDAGPDAIAADGADDTPLRLRSPIGVGHEAGRWFPYAGEPDLPGRQNDADGASLTFDTEPLPERFEILGEPVVDLEIASDRPQANLTVRLLDVDPEGVSTRVTYGILNLSHRDSHADPTPLVPGERTRVRIGLKHVAQAFPAGHRVRIAVSTDYWPLIWPAPEPAAITLHPAASRLTLPLRPPRSEEDANVHVATPADGAPPLEIEELSPPENARRVIRDVAGDGAVHEVVRDTGLHRIAEIDLTQRHRTVERFTNRGGDPTAVRAEIDHVSTLGRGDWETQVRMFTRLEVDEGAWHLYAELDAFEGDERFASRTWSSRVPRDHV
ncbi:MAG: CocE/NonD family hydrolase [Trueperaceae bacterium]